MLVTIDWKRALGLVVTTALMSTTAQAQDRAMVHTHLAHVASAFGATPMGVGLLPTARAEAEIAAQHAALAAEDLTNLEAMRRHAGHVMHALDPSVYPAGPGMGYGVKAATAGAALHLELAVGSDIPSENLSTHAKYIAGALAGVARRTDEAVALARRIESAPSATVAAPLATQLDALCRAIVFGRDANGDRLVGWQEAEGGLAQATYHMNLLQRGESLAP
jgi:hypothetical protein